MFKRRSLVSPWYIKVRDLSLIRNFRRMSTDRGLKIERKLNAKNYP